MPRKVLAACFYASAVALAVGCGLSVNGTDFGDFGENDASTDGSQFDTGSDSGGDVAPGDDASDGASDVASDTGDAGVDVDAGPCPQATLPLCDDDASTCGVGSKCAPSVPSGWRIVSYGAGPAACPSGFSSFSADAGRLAMFDASASSSCGCGCNTTPGSCSATASFATGAGATCDTDAGPAAVSASCSPLSISLPATFGAQGSQLTSGTTCQATTNADLPSADAGAAHVCGLDDAGVVCADHHYCVPLANGADRACIAHDGAQTCPSGFTALVAKSITDTRSCGCACSPSEGACTGRAHLFQDAGCTGGELVVPYDGGCQIVDAGADANFGFITFDVPQPTGAGCTASGGLDGGVDASVVTVCCTTP